MLRSLEKFTLSCLGRILLSYTLVSFSLLPGMSWFALVYTQQTLADAMTDAGKAGSIFGQSINSQAVPYKDDQGIHLPVNKEGGQSVLDINALFPGAGNSQDTVEILKEAYGDADKMRDTINAEVTKTQIDAKIQGSSASGDAYDVITNQVHRPRVDLRNDPIWNRTDQVQSGTDQIWTEVFEGCSEQVDIENQPMPVHIPDYKVCEILEKSNSCAVNRSIQIIDQWQEVYSYQGTFNSKQTITNTVPQSKGHQLTQSWNISPAGTASIVTMPIDTNNWTLGIEVIPPPAPPNGALLGTWCDGSSIDQYALYHDGTWGVYTTTNIKGCQVCDVKGNCSPAPATAKPIHTQPLATLTVHAYVPQLQHHFVDDKSGCGTDEFCRADLPGTCLDIDGKPIPGCTPPPCTQDCDTAWLCKDSAPTRWINGWLVSPDSSLGKLLPPLFDADKPPPAAEICYTAAAKNYHCPFNIGEIPCWTDPQGEEHCEYNHGESDNTCTIYEEDSNCRFLRQECIESATSSSGLCHAYARVYDCGIDQGNIATSEKVKITCDGPIRCMGNDCLTQPPSESNTDFSSAASALASSQFIAMDSNCPQDDPDGGCTVFKGQGLSCKKGLGGIVNCCKTDVAMGSNIGSYIKLATSSWALAKEFGMMDKLKGAGLNVSGAWESMTKPVTSAWSKITEPFTSAWEGVTGKITAAPIESLPNLSVSTLQQAAMEKLVQWTGHMFGPSAANSLFSQNAITGKWMLGGGQAYIGTMLSYVYIAYTVYILIVAIIQIIYKCRAPEFELASKRNMKLCNYIGSYCDSKILGKCIVKKQAFCCYNSQLAAIIQRDAGPGLGVKIGTAKNPICDGMTTKQMSKINWDQVNLGEWSHILQTEGIIPADIQTAEENYSMDTITTRSAVTKVYDDPNAQQRARSRMDKIEPENVRDVWAEKCYGDSKQCVRDTETGALDTHATDHLTCNKTKHTVLHYQHNAAVPFQFRAVEPKPINSIFINQPPAKIMADWIQLGGMIHIGLSNDPIQRLSLSPVNLPNNLFKLTTVVAKHQSGVAPSINEADSFWYGRIHLPTKNNGYTIAFEPGLYTTIDYDFSVVLEMTTCQ